MNSDLPMLEPDINSLLREYLVFAGMEKTAYALQIECKEKGKTLPASQSEQTDGSKLAAQNNILLEFDAGQYAPFWKLWEDHVPQDIRNKDHTCQRLEFYIQIHFAVYPIRISSIEASDNVVEEAMARFKKYLETSGASLSQTTEFLPFYALPFVPNPVQHPSFKDLFTPNWIPELRGRVERFLSAALTAAEPPVIIKLVKNKDRLLLDEDVSAQANAQLQQQLVQAERRCGVYMKRFNKLQSDYHILISITAELVDSLEQTVHGKMVTVEYLQSVCARLFNSRAVGSSANVASMDFTRPGTASSLLRASIIRDNMQHEAEEVALLPSLDYNKIKRDLMNGNDRTKALLLQALRWRLTRSVSGEQRDTVVDAFIANDIFGCRTAGRQGSFDLVSLLRSPDVVVRQYTARLFNAISSLQKGRSYLCQFPSGVRQLVAVLFRLEEETDRMCKEHLLGCLQKLSLRRSLQTVMIEGDLISWLVSVLSDFEALSDYMLEYAIALLMNLCLRSSGKRKCGDIAEEALKVLSKLLAHENSEIRPYVNGALYSILNNPTVRYIAQEMGLEENLKDLMEEEQAEFKRQLEFIVRQLNANPTEAENLEDSDDENDEDDDEDQDAMEADLDKDEALQLRPRDLSGEKFLCSEYLGIMTNSQHMTARHHPAVQSLVIDSGIPQRPTTPGHHRAAGDALAQPNQLGRNVQNVEESLVNMSLSMSYPSTLVASNTLNDSRPPTGVTPRPKESQQLGRPESASRRGGSRPTSSSSVRSGASRSIRRMPHDQESSNLLAEKTGVVRSLAPPVNNALPQPSGVLADADSDGIKEYTTVFSSRPRILRTPDVSNLSPRGVPPPLNPTYSHREPRSSRPGSASSWRGSKGSSGNAIGVSSQASISSARKQN